MSTLKTVNIQHPSSASVNAGTDTSGNFLTNSGYGSLATAYGCRAWVNFNGTGTTATNQTIRASGNVTSVYKNGTGDYTVNFTTALVDANYSAVGMSGDGTLNLVISPKSFSSSSLTIIASSASSGYVAASTRLDQQYINVAVFR